MHHHLSRCFRSSLAFICDIRAVQLRRGAIMVAAVATCAGEVMAARASDRNPEWPVMKEYTGEYTAAIGLPLGGIGTGTISLGGRGDLRDWEMVNRSAIGWVPAFKLDQPAIATAPFFVVYAKPQGEKGMTLLLEGPIPQREQNVSGDWGAETHNAGMPRFEENNFLTAYPFGQIVFKDKAMPIKVRLEAFNPLIPGDADASGLPIAVLRYVLTNPTNRVVDAAVCGVIPNFIGHDGWVDEGASERNSKRLAHKNRNEFRAANGVSGIFMSGGDLDPENPKWGTFALSTPTVVGVSHRTAWKALDWRWDFLNFWDDFSEDGELVETPNPEQHNPPGSLAVKVSLKPGETKAVTFHLTWHFPNRMSWFGPKKEKIGNYYTTQFADAWDAAVQIAPRLPKLENATIDFVRTFVSSDYPDVLEEAALFNLSVLRSQTVFRTPDGHIFGWEGSGSIHGTAIGTAKSRPGGWGMGSCTHVWNYEVATPFLFGDLAMGMREVEFLYSTNPVTGEQAHRVILPLKPDGANRWKGKPAADGQMGTLVKMYRDWQLSGDDERLKKMWTHIKAALSFAWRGGVWDTDANGVMDGEQHNTMDVEYVGPNPQMAAWYLAALRAGEEMAKAVGDREFEQECADLHVRGRKWVEANLFNGSYYIQKFPDPENPPGAQVGEGILVDQLVGQYLAHIAGLGYVLDRGQVGTTLATIKRENWVTNFNKHLNPFRSYAVGHERGLLMASYPPGKRLAFPFPYYGEVMTGFEYSTAAHLIMEGQTEAGLEVFEGVRERFDGRKRNPFDDGEFGHRYGRAMASWAGLLAWSGFNYSAPEQSMRVHRRPGTYFWSNGYSYGTYRVSGRGRSRKVTLAVVNGGITLRDFALTGFGAVKFDSPRTWDAGSSQTFEVARTDGEWLPEDNDQTYPLIRATLEDVKRASR